MQKEEILSRLDKRDFFKTFLTDLKEGRRGQGKACCPFHPDKTPSLSIDLQRGLFNCFGCGAKGDVFTFLQKLKGIDFVTALEEGGKIAGVSTSSRNGNSEVVATYRYEDTEGTVLYSKERVAVLFLYNDVCKYICARYIRRVGAETNGKCDKRVRP